MSTPLKVAYLGNYGEHNTESHVARALEYNGHEVIRVQENTPTSFDSITQECGDVDFVLWTRTGWDWNHVFGSKDGDAIAHARQYRMLDWLRRRHIPSVAFHLDRWVDLDREYQLATEPRGSWEWHWRNRIRGGRELRLYEDGAAARTSSSYSLALFHPDEADDPLERDPQYPVQWKLDLRLAEYTA